MTYPIKKLGEICELATGGTPSRTHSEYFGGNIKWLVSGDIHQKEIFDCEGRITEAGAKNSNAKILPKNSVLIALNGQGKTRATVAVLRTKATCNQSLVAILPSPQVIPEFIYQNLNWRYLEIRALTGMDNRRGLNMGIIRSLEIPLPSLSEQKKIVARLEKLLGQIKEAKKLRVEAQEAAQNLLPAALHKIFSEGKKKEWEEKTLGEICEIARGGSPRPIQHYLTDSKDGINWVKISDATSSTKYIYETKQKIKKEGLFKTRLVKPGDFILTNSMSFGRPYIMKTNGAIHDGWLLLRPQKSLLEEYMYYFLSSDEIYNQFSRLAGGAVVQNLNSELVRSVKILIPPLPEQKKIVAYLDSLSQKVRTLQQIQSETADQLKELEQSILHQAFSGKLI